MRSFSEYLEVVQEGKTKSKSLLSFETLGEEIEHYEDQLSLSSANQSAIPKLKSLYQKLWEKILQNENISSDPKRQSVIKKQLNILQKTHDVVGWMKKHKEDYGNMTMDDPEGLVWHAIDIAGDLGKL